MRDAGSVDDRIGSMLEHRHGGAGRLHEHVDGRGGTGAASGYGSALLDRQHVDSVCLYTAALLGDYM